MISRTWSSTVDQNAIHALDEKIADTLNYYNFVQKTIITS